MVDFDLVKRVAKALNMSDTHVMQTTFVELMEDMVNELDVKNEEIEKLKNECEILKEMKDSLNAEKKELEKGYNRVSAKYKYEKNSHINSLCREAHGIAQSKGWYDEPVPVTTSILLIHAELSEAVEALRKDNMENFKEELADVAIRLFDLCGYMDVNLGQAIDKKMEKNRSRSYRHGGKKF